jgi:hypothetical protein
MARRRNNQEIKLDLDTFLDVITNCIGVLMVITILAMINTKYMTFIVRTPFVRHTEKRPVFFECRNNRVIAVNKVNIQQQLEAYVEEISKNSYDYSRIANSTNLELKDVGDKYYRVDLAKLFRNNILVLVPKADIQGEPAEALRDTGTDFQRILKQIDPTQRFAFFLVRPDSFEAFRAARKLLWKKDIEVGWEPITEGQFISFGAKGRRPTVD